ncbi:16210_t:CDS:10, partial [Funneliformis mosseae]
MAARIGIGLEENESLKQHKVLQEENRETLRINSELKEELQEKDKQSAKLQQKVLNLESQNNEFEITSQTLEKSLEIIQLAKNIKIPPKIRGALIIQELEEQIIKFIVAMRTVNGKDYKAQSVKVGVYAIARYLSEHSVIHQAGTSEVAMIFKHPQLDKSTPEGLLYHVFQKYNFLLLRGGEHYKLLASNFKKKNDGCFTVCLYESKANQRNINQSEAQADILYISGDDPNIIQDYDDYFEKRPVDSDLQFNLQPNSLEYGEVAMIYCMKQLQKHELETGINFMVVDCGSDTVDLTTQFASEIKQYITDKNKKHLEIENWLIELNFNDIKSMFDPIVNIVLQLIQLQLNNSPKTCLAIVRIILTPIQPTIAIERRAVIYGLSSMNLDSNVIASRIIKYTYSIKVRKYWTKDYSIHRKVNNRHINKIHCLAKRDTLINVNQKITYSYLSLYSTQTKVVFYLYYTNEFDAKYYDKSEMKLLEKLTMNLPSS